MSGYIGTILRPSVEYVDTVAQSEALFELSNTENALFLLDPKGHFLRIHTAAATTLAIDHKKKVMPQTVTVSWVEIGNADNVHLIMYPGGDFYPVDRVILTSIHIDLTTGALIWTVPDGYAGTGSTLSLNADGALVQNTDGSYNAATMTLDQDTGNVIATLADG